MVTNAQSLNLAVNLRANSASLSQDMSRARQAVTSNTSRMNRALAKAERGFVSLQGSVASTVKGMLSWQTVLGSVAGAAGLGYLVKMSLDASKQLSKLSTQTGFNVERIQALEFAAHETGVRTERLHDALGELSQRMGEAAADGGEMAEGFQAAGISIDGLAQRNPGAVLNQIAEAISNAKTESQALNIAVKTFGDEGGRDMVAMLREGTDGLDRMAEKARDMGLILDKSMIQQSSKAHAKISMLADVVNQQFTHAVAELAPTITKATSAMTKFLGTLGDALWVSRKEELQKINQEIASLENKLRSMNQVSDEDRGFLAKYLYGEQDERIQGVEQRLSKLRQERKALQAEIAQYNKRLTQGAGTPSPRTTGGSAGDEEGPTYTRGGPNFFFGGVDAPAGIGSRNYGADDAEMRRLIERRKQAAERINQVHQNSLEARKTALERYAEDSTDLHQQVNRAAVNSVYSIENALVRAARTGKLEWKDMVDSMLADLMRLTVRQSITGPLAKGLSSGISSYFNSPNLHDTNQSSMAGGINPGGTFQTRASGGPVSSGQTYLVGEKGPELLHMGSKSGYVQPNTGGTVVQVIDQRSGGQPVQTEESQGPDGRKQIKLLIKDEMQGLMADGSMDRTMDQNYGIKRRAF